MKFFLLAAVAICILTFSSFASAGSLSFVLNEADLFFCSAAMCAKGAAVQSIVSTSLQGAVNLGSNTTGSCTTTKVINNKNEYLQWCSQVYNLYEGRGKTGSITAEGEFQVSTPGRTEVWIITGGTGDFAGREGTVTFVGLNETHFVDQFDLN